MQTSLLRTARVTGQIAFGCSYNLRTLDQHGSMQPRSTMGYHDNTALLNTVAGGVFTVGTKKEVLVASRDSASKPNSNVTSSPTSVELNPIRATVNLPRLSAVFAIAVSVPRWHQVQFLHNMDWTGGVRRRFAPGKNNATLRKQKAHFAKARAALHNTPSSRHTFQPSFVAKRSPSLSHQQRHARLEHDHREEPGSVPVAAGSLTQRGDQRQRLNHPQELPAYSKRQIVRRSPSIIYVSSRSALSSASSAISKHTRRKHNHSKPMANGAKAISGVEEEWLIDRRRLLARTDWLGLSATRPVHMKFPSSHDKERIGKRRKVARSALYKSQPAGQRLFTTLFEERLLPRELMMSGAILPEDIQVKIGTDALASQTQRSRQSHTPGKASVRHPSTEFGPLSEEPMLLGADGDMFESLQSPEAALHRVEPWVSDAHALQLPDDNTLTRDVQYVPGRPEMRIERVQSEVYEHSHLDSIRQHRVHELNSSDRVPDSEQPEFLDRMAAEERTANRAQDHSHQQCSFPMQDLDTNYADSKNIAMSKARDADDHETWRRLLNIEQYQSSHGSMAALRSSSLHLTASDSDRRPIVEVSDQPGEGTQPFLSTPKGAGTQASMIHRQRENVCENQSSILSGDLKSPSTSLKQILKLAEQPAPLKRHGEEEDDENALWREFICGSEADSQEIPLQQSADWEQTNVAKDMIPSSDGHSRFHVSDLGTSNKTTIGDGTSVMTDSIPSALLQRLIERKAGTFVKKKANRLRHTR